MSAPMKKHPIKAEGYVEFVEGKNIYKIPKNVAKRYIVDQSNKNFDKDAKISSDKIFSDLENRLTKSGALLKGLRTRENMTQLAFAKKIGVTQSNLSSMENGRRAIGKEIAKRLELKFKVNYRYFLE